jgi:HD-GYP domain-containing protein (c-di-GMP phosphodiesterase class II)
MSHREACRILAEGSGSHFDPDVIESFIACQSYFESVSNEHLLRLAHNECIETSSPEPFNALVCTA